VDKFCEEFEQTRPTNNNSDQLISQEETERKLREKLEFELAAKERQITTLVIETQKLQSTLIKIKETSFTQVNTERERKRLMNHVYLFFLFRFLILKML